jgi:hypothetical protein
MTTVDKTTSTDLAVPNTTGALALPTDDPWAGVESGYVGDRNASEVTPVVPRLMFNANKGYGFIDELTGDVIGEGSTIACSWLAWSESRAYWSQPFGQGNEAPDCRSINMIVPDEGVPDRQAETCAACHHSKWTDEGPSCGVRVNVLLWLISVDGDLTNGGRITRTAFRGIAVKHVRRYLGFFASKGVKLPPMSHITQITVGSEKTDYGDKLVPEFHISDRVAFAEAEPLIAAREEFLSEWRSTLADDLARPEGDGAAVPPEVIDAGSDEEPF